MDTWRWPNASYSVLSICATVMPSRAAVSRSMVTLVSRPLFCRSLLTSASSGCVCSAASIFGAQANKLIRRCRPGACIDTAHWRHARRPGYPAPPAETASPRNLGQLSRAAGGSPDPPMILRSPSGLSEMKTNAPLVCAATAGEADHRVDRRVLPNDRDELLQLLPHQLERDALVGLDAAVDAAGILLREEALRHDDEQIDIEAERGSRISMMNAGCSRPSARVRS